MEKLSISEKKHVDRLYREATVLGSDSFHMLNSVQMEKNIHFSSLHTHTYRYISGVCVVPSAVRILYAHEMESVLFPSYSLSRTHTHTEFIPCTLQIFYGPMST